MGDISASIEETNKIRASLGLKPLKVEDSEKDPEKIAEENYAKIKEEQIQKADSDKILESIEKSKNRINLKKKLAGKTLGEPDDEDDSAIKWLKKSSEKLRESAKNKVTPVAQTSVSEKVKSNDPEHDIAVGHDLEDFDEGQEVFLTLKDTGVLEEGEDELVSIQIQEREKLQKNLENKKKKKAYNPYDDEDDLGYNQQRTILGQYDEDIDGAIKRKRGFKISAYTGANFSGHSQNSNEVLPEGTAISLDYNNMKEVQDYYTKEEAEVVFKKPKTKKKKSRRKTLPVGEDAFENEEEFVVPTQAPEANFVDDDDLQQALAKARRVATKRTPIFNEEELADQMQEVHETIDGDNVGSDIMTISDTSEFVQNLTAASALQTEKMLRTQQRQERPTVPTNSVEALESAEASADSPEQSPSPKDSSTMENPESLVEDEKPIGKGLASALEALSKKGLYSRPSDEQIKRDRVQSEHAKWVLEQRKKDLYKEKERIAEKHRDHRARQRGHDRDRDDDYQRDRAFAEEQQQRMANYHPDVNIRHMDSSGNVLNAKEAFRQLSHKFHGKTSGMKKTEKRMAKIENEKRISTMTSSDTPLGTASALAQRQKAKGTAHIVLDGHK